MLDKRYQCNIASSWVRQGRMPDQTRIDQARAIRGCYKEITDPTLYHRHSNIIFKRCVCCYFDSNINTLLDYNEFFKVNRTLPDDYIYKTGVISNKMLMALRIVDGFLMDKQAEEVKKQNENAKKQGSSRGRK